MSGLTRGDMSQELRSLSVEDFLDRLSSGEPTPGGGSASALAGALAAALVCMVCRLTLGRNRFLGVAPLMEKALDDAQTLQRRLLDGLERDSGAYQDVMTAYAMARATEAEKASRSEAIQRALREATRVPLSVASDCADALRLAQVVIEQGNPSAASDARVAALLGEAGGRGALLNVRINLPSIHDVEFVDKSSEEAREIEARLDRMGRVDA